ncbi:DNA polymerase type-X family protein [Lachnellula occidentalis]|uniref:DNA polymerase n=1 Tax=Lachnellula occidentalis TaxID=215460 RepID=A0A8H8U9K0_9HELO|nr:DNA polymerase type-X family protein [Lachnellula occidentalis]
MALEFPPIYLLKAHFKDLSELNALGKKIGVVFNTKEEAVNLFLAHEKLKSKVRIELELRQIGVATEAVVSGPEFNHGKKEQAQKGPPPRKRRKVEKNSDGRDLIVLDSSTESETDSETERNSPRSSRTASPSSPPLSRKFPLKSDTKSDGFPAWDKDIIKVLRVAWYDDSVKAGQLLPTKEYLVYEGRVVSGPKPTWPIHSKPHEPHEPLKRLPLPEVTGAKPYDKYRTGRSKPHSTRGRTRTPPLLHENTSDREEESQIPDLPDDLKQPYSCKRETPLHTPNHDFIAQLKVIKEARLLTDAEENSSEWSVRAYTGAISSIAAYPFSLASARELSRLPGVGLSTVEYFKEWKRYGYITEVENIRKDERITVWRSFYGIFDVGAKTARDWYNKGWRDLDDVAQAFGSLSRSQQIGLKFYEEFEERMSRDEVEKIGAVVLREANRIEPGFEMVICGGYRRGKPDMGDVDVVLTHRDENATSHFIDRIRKRLDETGHITHSLRQHNTNSNRGQDPLAWKGNAKREGRKAGFDTLDKIFVAWQDPEWPSKAEDLKRNPQAKNPNIHRRVDIIVTPWKTAGCAIIGWSGGNMFERDLRLYCKQELGYKFDSSGVRRVDNGIWVDLEAGADTLLEKEKKVFKGLGLKWIEPTLRCTD